MPHVKPPSRGRPSSRLIVSGLAAASLGATSLLSQALVGTAAAAAYSDAKISMTPAQVARFGLAHDVVSTGLTNYAAGPSASSTPGHQAGSSKRVSPDDVTLEAKDNLEGVRGVALTATLPGAGSDWVAINTQGGVSRLSSDGTTVWSTTSQTMYDDWQVTPQLPYQTYPYTPVMVAGVNPSNPASVASKRAFAVGDLTGDGVADVAVSYQVGVSPTRPFNVPYSTLTAGTFVSVFDGVTGAMDWSKLYPGYANQLMYTDGSLIVGNTTGPDWGHVPVAEQGDSRSMIERLAFTGSGDDLQATQVWTYNTKVPWGVWAALEPVGQDKLAAAWTDTPTGLGSPRPADGHILLFDAATGAVDWSVDTPGYPRMVRFDDARNQLVVAEENDPGEAVRLDLTTFQLGDGARAVLNQSNGMFPLDLRIGDVTGTGSSQYVVSSLAVDADFVAVNSTVRAVDPASGSAIWTRSFTGDIAGQPPLAADLTLTSSGVAVNLADQRTPSITNPYGDSWTMLRMLVGSTGATRWERTGPVSSAMNATVSGSRIITAAADQTVYSYDLKKGTAEAMPLVGDIYTAVDYDVNGDGVKDLIMGGQSRLIEAVDGSDLNHVLWRSVAVGAVHQIKLADTMGDDTPEVVVAATRGVMELDPATGVVLKTIDAGDGFVWSVSTGPLLQNGKDQLVIPTNRLWAYTGAGKQLWTYRPQVGVAIAFSSAAIDPDGRVLDEYTAPFIGLAANAPTPPKALSLNGRTGKLLWIRQPATGDTVEAAQLWNGVYTSKYVPGTDGHTVAFTWTGDQSGAGWNTRVELRDSRNGKVVKKFANGGPFTHYEYFSTPELKLEQMRSVNFTRTSAKLKLNNLHTLPTPRDAAPGVLADGSPFVAAAGAGLELWSNDQLKSDTGNIESPIAYGGRYADDALITADLDGDGSSELIGMTLDAMAYRLMVKASGGDFYSPESRLHGVEVLTVNGAIAKAQPKPYPTVSAGTTGVQQPTVGSSASGTVHDPIDVGPSVPASQVHGKIDAYPGYVPSQINGVLQLTGDGEGQTVAIVDAYDAATAEADLNLFSNEFGLPQSCGSSGAGEDCFDFEKTWVGDQQPPASTSWALEVALDVQWVHAVAPKAKIVLVEAQSAAAADMWAAVDKAASYHPAAISNSWGMSEFSGQGFYSGHCQLDDSVCVAAAGDFGYPGTYGATDPAALSVGGTTLKLNVDGTVASETAWRSTGGGASYFMQRPDYQDGVQSTEYRGAPDVSFDADSATGVSVYTSYSGIGRWYRVGGTSLSAPVWAAILAVTNQQRAADGKAPLSGGDHSVHRAIYGLSTGLYDVDSGSNGACGTECTAGVGYDFLTGVGSPRPGIDTALAATP